MFIILKTHIFNNIYKVKSEVICTKNTMAQIALALSELIDNKFKNDYKEDGVVKCYYRSWIGLQLHHIYQILEIPDDNIKKNDHKNHKK